MTKQKTFPGADVGIGRDPGFEGLFDGETEEERDNRLKAWRESPSVNDVLAAAAATAQPGAQPDVQGQPPELATQVDQAATQGSNEPEPTIQAVYSLERARALPELHQDLYMPFESDDPRAILAFKDADDRTMRVAVDLNCLAKIEVRREPVA